MSMARKALVAGGAGFLGSHVCDRLLEEGWQVCAIDDLSSGNADNLNSAHSRHPGRIELIEHDVRIPLSETSIQGVELILNFACPASPPKYQANPLYTLETSFLGARNLLEAAASNGATYLQASTSEIYGDPLEHPQRESYWGNVNCVGPRSCYDEGKRVAETLCIEYRRMKKVDSKIVRIFNTYGPRMDAEDGRVVSNLVNQALSGRDLTIFGDGSQTRSFCFVSDLVEGLIKMSLSPKHIQGPVNLGNPEEYSMLETARLIQKLTGGSLNLVFMPLPGDDPRRRRPDISLAKASLGWEPRVSFEDGLKMTIEHFKSQNRRGQGRR